MPSRPARATALVQLAQDMPPAVLAALLGLHLNTVTRWRSRAVTDWTAYLEARTSSRAAAGCEPGSRAVLGHEPSAGRS
ncbi:helix-turn-helix domain-containing protein [Streptomyces sp. MBT65]|uniref:helix-turn-helix domain-containing protein n=1 Tax=Streptomyces sp. MBT65 TaxID=1488395 RepID=UPI0035B0C3F4